MQMKGRHGECSEFVCVGYTYSYIVDIVAVAGVAVVCIVIRRIRDLIHELITVRMPGRSRKHQQISPTTTVHKYQHYCSTPLLNKATAEQKQTAM